MVEVLRFHRALKIVEGVGDSMDPDLVKMLEKLMNVAVAGRCVRKD